MSYVYKRQSSVEEGTLYLVGFWPPGDGKFIIESTQETASDAARRVNYLNGGNGNFFLDHDKLVMYGPTGE